MGFPGSMKKRLCKYYEIEGAWLIWALKRKKVKKMTVTGIANFAIWSAWIAVALTVIGVCYWITPN